MERPYTSAASLRSPSTSHMPRFHESFGSTNGRYMNPSMSRKSLSQGTQSSGSFMSSPSSSYLRSRGAMTATPMRGGTSRERGGAAGNQLVSPSLSRKLAPEGTPLRGVTAFPFDKQQTAYIDDFAPSIAYHLVHPFNAITENNADSTSFNIITGSAYQGTAPLHSEYKRQFAFGAGNFRAPAKRHMPFGADNPGLRSEEMITVGQYTPVLRSF